MHIQDFKDYELHQATTKEIELYLAKLHAKYKIKSKERKMFNWKFMTGYKSWFYSKNNDNT